MIKTNDDDKSIIIPRGDTGVFTVSITGEIQPDAVPIFAVSNSFGHTYIAKQCDISDGVVTVALDNADTKNISGGEYNWDIRLVTRRNADNNDDIYASNDIVAIDSIFSANGLPKFIVTEVPVNV